MCVIFVCYVKYLAWLRRCWVLRRRKLNHIEMELNRGNGIMAVHTAVGVLAKQKLISSVAISSAISLGQQFKLLNWHEERKQRKNWLESFQMDYLKVNLQIEEFESGKERAKCQTFTKLNFSLFSSMFAKGWKCNNFTRKFIPKYLQLKCTRWNDAPLRFI